MKINNTLNEYYKITKYGSVKHFELTNNETLEIIEKAFLNNPVDIDAEIYDFLKCVISTAYRIGFVRGTKYINTGRK